MIDFRLKVFCSVAHNLSFTKASKELYVSQPAISKHIQELETEYSTRLFERMGTHITLTPRRRTAVKPRRKNSQTIQTARFRDELIDPAAHRRASFGS